MAQRDFDEQVDPFNAGEPVMPGDDSSTWHDSDEACNLDDGSYEAPQKKNARSNKEFELQPSPADNVDTDEEDVNNADWDEDEDENRIKAGVKSNINSRKFFIIVAVIIVVASLAILGVRLVFALISRTADRVADAIEDKADDTIDGDYDDLLDELEKRGYEVEAWTGSGVDEDEELAKAYIRMVVDQRLDALKEDDNMRQRIIDDFNFKFENAYGFEPADAGLDAGAYADKVLSGYTYEIGNTYVFLSANEGSVFVDITAYQFWNFGDFFDETGGKYLSDNFLLFPETPSFTAEQKAQLRTYYDEAMNAEWETYDTYNSFSFTLEGDTWSIDEDDYQDEIDNAFSIYYGSSYYASYYEENIGEDSPEEVS